MPFPLPQDKSGWWWRGRTAPVWGYADTPMVGVSRGRTTPDPAATGQVPWAVWCSTRTAIFTAPHTLAERTAMPSEHVLGADQLGKLIEALVRKGYEVIGPTLRDGAIVYDNVESVEDLPAGWTD